MKILRNFAALFILLINTSAFGQNVTNGGVEMADRLKQDGKIYVVIGVVLIILIGLLVYLVSIDRKVSKIEKNIASGNKDNK